MHLPTQQAAAALILGTTEKLEMKLKAPSETARSPAIAAGHITQAGQAAGSFGVLAHFLQLARRHKSLPSCPATTSFVKCRIN